MHRMLVNSLSAAALALLYAGICQTAMSADAVPPPPVAVETGSLESNGIAAIGAAARRLIEPAAITAPAHLVPNDTTTTAMPAAEPPKPSPEDLDRTALATFYQSRGDEPLWVTESGFTPKALLALAELRRAGEYGFDPADFAVSEPGVTPSPDALAAAESSLSLAVLTYARHARGGKIAKPSEQLSSYFDRRPQWKDRGELLADLAKAEDPGRVLIALHPQHPQFELLRQAWLETLRAKGAKRAPLPAGTHVGPGDRHPDVVVLRKRLDVPAETGAAADLYDERLAAAVRGFQTLKGLAADGVLTTETRAKLNQPIKGNTDQLAANMQMWRYIPADLGEMHVMLNVPEYEIRIRKAGEDVFDERVTVGLVNKQTPIFSDQIELVTFKSRWRVPNSIKVREIWPSLIAGGGLMRQHKLELRRRKHR